MKTLTLSILLILFSLTASAQRKPSVFLGNCERQKVNPYFSEIKPSGYLGACLIFGTFFTVNRFAGEVTAQQRDRIALSCMTVSVVVYTIAILIEERK